ncbi:DAK2 domain-containing protein [Tissierella sp. MSJ-40]|uniref:DAK2 domain-containing protein n=1 Tax=Tissierella simiarum TaxID=2841534 RepID=A0ABS6E4B1_9FIRM|nr:DAK2 domain-containing protein [Tissierella simiarum]MBU5437750.1 DAK2 domain-containing protein [Tissierella simiarum]
MKVEIIDGTLLKKALVGAAKFLEDNKEEVNSLNVFPVPDGDTGTNMSLTMKSSIKQILDLEEYSASKVALAASTGSLMGARGNSGVILSQIFRGFANGLKDKETIDTKILAEAFKQAADTAYKAVMKPTEGTILTVARECGEYGLTIYKEEKDILVFLKKVIEHGNIVLNKTPEMLPVLKQAGVVDAGGKGLIYVLTGAYNALTNDKAIELDFFKSDISKKLIDHGPIETDDIKYGYCTEFIVNTKYNDIDSFRKELSIQGDSLLVVGGEGLIKVHIHTNNPGLVLEKALSLGELNDIKIDNMRYQHNSLISGANYAETIKHDIEEKEEIKEKKKYSFISVSIGEGIDKVFKELHVDVIIPGGQTMNPSTEDILNAVEEVEGENIFILPNNGNIILAAEQARELSSKNIIVFPTKTIPQGISALLAFDENLTVEENSKNMEEAINHVITGQVTYAVRDTEFNNTKIHKDDIIGISKGDILATGKDITEVAIKLIEGIINEDTSLITIFYGNNLSEEEAENLAEKLQEQYDDFDVEVVFGGQPLYYYIFSIE